ncbi:MAG: RNA 2',3'-cyclic phosphodiesterase [Gammaproteobacteria bacterium]|nr:MAG: RNA 2',3'-cyclic phosphodiesterase [Gammaproteobacteria bacterium]
MAAPDKPTARRLFFAIYPDAATRQRLADAAQPLITEGKSSPADNLHLTLAFIGLADTATQRCLTEKAAQIDTPKPFNILIDQTGHFQKARILWLGPGRIPAELSTLHDDLAAAIQPCGYALENRPWTPHVTIARKYRGNASGSLKNPITLQVDTFSLMESVSSPSGVRYVELQKFRLRKGG